MVLCGLYRLLDTLIIIIIMQFEESMIVYDACRLIRERVPDADSGQRKCGRVWH